MSRETAAPGMAERFRGFLPVVVDLETGGFDPQQHALLELAVVTLCINAKARWQIDETLSRHITPFPGARLDPESMRVNGIQVEHPFRRQIAVEETQALREAFSLVRAKIRQHGCSRAILTGHNAAFDLDFLKAAAERNGVRRNPFHPFSTFDTVTLAGLAYGQTVLSRAVQASGGQWDAQQAHHAHYDAEQTAKLFCRILNGWEEKNGARNGARNGKGARGGGPEN